MKKFLFACSENACRSQMAEGFANAMAGERVAESAGTFPVAEVNPLAVEVMSEVGIDISAHEPKLFRLEDVDRFDRIISFGCIPRAAFPAPERLEDWLIPDPAGKDIEAFRAVRDEIRLRVERLLGPA
jgi:protein-tyrosine-phosphatase